MADVAGWGGPATSTCLLTIMPHRLSLKQFVGRVRTNCIDAVSSELFCPEQRALLRSTIDQLFRHTSAEDWGQPLGLFYAVYRMCGAGDDELALVLGRFSAFYIASADLFDDVQDDDLRGKPHAQAGVPIATNSALTLLTLGLDALGEASELEERPDRRLRYLRLFNRVSLIAVAAQHRDLMGGRGASTRAEVEAMHRGKTSSLALLCECAALAGGADDTAARHFFDIGEELAAMVQVIDDVRDLVAKDNSVDLLTQKSTYPLACFHERTDEAARTELANLLAAESLNLDAIRALLDKEGAFDDCAVSVETHRLRIQTALSRFPSSSHSQLLAEIVHHLASALYDPPQLDCSIRPERGVFGRAVEKSMGSFLENMSGLTLRPVDAKSWHLPIFLYSIEHEQMFFSDLDGLPEEVVPFHAELLGLSLDETHAQLVLSVPFVVAHELTHAARHQFGLLGHDAWHEEYVANAIAWAYVSKYEPMAAQTIIAASSRIHERGRSKGSPSERSRLIADAAFDSRAERDYACSPQEAAWIHAEMVLNLSQGDQCLEELISRYLTLSNVPVAAE